MKQPNHITEFRRLKNRHIILYFIGFLIIGMLFYTLLYPEIKILGLSTIQIEISGITILGLILIYGTINWKCPKCNKGLGRLINPKYCPNCGVELRK
jgi:hypothetical protein